MFHAIADLATWQVATGRQFDVLIQVGDMGAFPDPLRMDAAARRCLAVDAAEDDFRRLLRADGTLAEHLRRIRKRFAGPVYFVRGNHEDFDYLARPFRSPSVRTR